MLEIADGGSDIDKLNIELVMGDMTGYIHIQDQQQFYVEFDAYSVLRSSPPSNFIVRNEHINILPESNAVDINLTLHIPQMAHS